MSLVETYEGVFHVSESVNNKTKHSDTVKEDINLTIRSKRIQ